MGYGEHLQLLRVRIEDGQEEACVRLVRIDAGSVRHHESEPLRVGRSEGEIVAAADGNRSVESHQPSETAVPPTVLSALMVPTGVHQIDVAAAREGHLSNGTVP